MQLLLPVDFFDACQVSIIAHLMEGYVQEDYQVLFSDNC